mmetsp:Transcript_78677/g.138759  ORF Transcript_78677/g.138759 Transcript_78677/m.138759 type:complete len:1058 (+) Transcript_78677:171-3344(+)
MTGQAVALPKLTKTSGRNFVAGGGPHTARAHKPAVKASLPPAPLSARQSQTQSSWRTFDEEPPEVSKFGVSASTMSSWTPALKATLQEWDRPAAALDHSDLRRNAQLKRHLSNMRISDYFNKHGENLFEGLGLSFAAKQNKQVSSTFGSQADLHADFRFDNEELLQSSAPAIKNAKTYLAAAEALSKDMVFTKNRAEALLLQVSESEEMKTEEVQERRLGLLFLEIPYYQAYLPKTISLRQVVPDDVTEEREYNEKILIERQNAHLSDRNWFEGMQMNWIMSMDEVLTLSQDLERWTTASRGSNLPMGMDRATFCRFLHDAHLWDKKKVPYFWAVQLFDGVAQQARCCPPNAQNAATAALQGIASKWRLISVVDVIIRQHAEAIQRYDILTRIHEASLKIDGATASIERQTSSVDEKDHDHPHFEEPDSDNHDEDHSKKALAHGSSRHLEKAERKSVSMASSESHGEYAKRSERSAKASLERDSAHRERLLSSMLLEPEILHLVVLYQEIFIKLYRCYAGRKRHMDFPELLQFCVDFQIAPYFITQSSLKSLYESAVCLDIKQKEDKENHEEISVSDAMAAFQKTARQAGKVSLAFKDQPDAKNKDQKAASPEKQQVPESVPESSKSARAARQESKNDKHLGGASSKTNNLSASRSSGAVPRKSASFETRTSKRGSAWQLPVEPPARPKQTEFEGYFSETAFMETLCKVAFLHLGFYGNAMQSGSTSCFKLTWLIAYLRYVMEHIRKSAKRHPELSDSPAHRSIEAVSDEMWANPPVLESLLDCTPTLLQPEPGPGNKKLPKRRGRHQDMAPRLRPALKTEALALETWRQKRRISAQETLSKARSSIVLVNSMSSKKMSEMEQVKDDTSDEEDEFLKGIDLAQKSSFLPDPAAAKTMTESAQLVVPTDPVGGLLPMEDLFVYEAGKAGILEGGCQLCGRVLAGEALQVKALDLLTKGNPQCRCCSIVDAMVLSRHPFSRLMMTSTNTGMARVGAKVGKLNRPKAKPHVGDPLRCAYSPVPEPMASGLGSGMVLGTRHGHDRRGGGRDLEATLNLPAR